MAINYPGPYELRYHYTVDTTPGGALEHQFRHSVVLEVDPTPGDAFSTINVVLSGGGTLALHTSVASTVAVVDDLLSAADATIDFVELWKYTAGTFQADFISSFDISAAGTNVGATVPANQNIYTFRTAGGGILKFTLLDVPGAVGAPVAYASLAATHQALVDYIKHASSSPFYARDNSRPFAFLRFFPGNNEAVFKERYGR